MTIETKLDQKEYTRLMYVVTYRKPIMIFITIIGITMILSSIAYLIGYKDLFTEPPYVLSAIGFIFVFLFPFSIYMNAKRNFSSYGKLQEKIIYEFTNEKIKVIGESFNSEMTWEKTFKITELKNWILIYQNKQVFFVIEKESFGTNLPEFKSIVMSKNIKSKLKK